VSDANNTRDVRAGLTKNESLALSSLSEKGTTIFRLKDISAVLNCSYKYAKVLANNLVKKKWIIALSRGTYLIVPLSAGAKPRYTEHEFVIASYLVSPYYIAYWSALNFHAFTEQTPFTVFVATTKRIKDKEILNVKYNFVTLSGKKFFGFTPAIIGPHKVNISDQEKTLADALDHPEYCGGISEVAECIWNAKEKISFTKMVTYAEKMGNTAIVKRLGYIAESLKIDVDARILAKMKDVIAPGISVLDPMMPRKGSYITRWNLLVNVSREALEERHRGFDYPRGD
jgi:predicted transcriptional regulator of viral defense system